MELERYPVTVEQMAKGLGCTVRALYSRVQRERGCPPPRRVGGELRWTKAQLQRARDGRFTVPRGRPPLRK